MKSSTAGQSGARLSDAAVMVDLIVDPAVRGRVARAERNRLRVRFERMVRAAWLTEQTERPLQVAVRLTDDAAIRELNRDYRDRDRPTDVLAFALREAPGGMLCPELLGDIVISVETASEQAKREVKTTLTDELLLLGAHGLCHLLGYDHQTDAEESEMNARMAALLREAERRGPTRAA